MLGSRLKARRNGLRAIGLFVFILPACLASGLELPRSLNSSDRDQVVRILGSNSAIKPLSNPYPLGGYSGFEFGVSMEFINVRDLERLGTRLGPATTENSDWQYSRISIGKGVYNDVDVFFSFLIPGTGGQVKDYGGMARWSFYQAQFLPVNLSLAVHGNQTNINDAFINRNLGAEILLAVNVDHFSLYFGGGLLQSSGTFVGCPNGYINSVCTVDATDPALNRNSNTVTNTVTENHSVVGVSFHLYDAFLAAQVDRYEDAVYSAKMGLRF